MTLEGKQAHQYARRHLGFFAYWRCRLVDWWNRPATEVEEACAMAYQAGVIVEREACAKVCDEQANEPECPERAAYCADAIRARGSCAPSEGAK